MKEFLGTKRGWRISEKGSNEFCIVGYKGSAIEDAANKRLILNAPELLELIQEMSEYLEPKEKGQINSIKTTSIFHSQMKSLLDEIL